MPICMMSHINLNIAALRNIYLSKTLALCTFMKSYLPLVYNSLKPKRYKQFKSVPQKSMLLNNESQSSLKNILYTNIGHQMHYKTHL